jgi:hypothetical protein
LILKYILSNVIPGTEYLACKGNSEKVWVRIDKDGNVVPEGDLREATPVQRVACARTYPAWSNDILNQLSPGMRALFPCLLSHHLGMDWKVVEMMRSRSAGNTPTDLREKLRELYFKDHRRKETR